MGTAIENGKTMNALPSATPPRRQLRLTLTAGGLVLLAGALVGMALATGSSDPGSSVPAPDIAFERFDGSAASLADYRDRPLVVNFWASWCPSCVAELSAAFLPVQDALGEDVAFLGLNLQDDRRQALALIDQTGVRFDLAEDASGDLYEALGGIGMPFTVLIDQEGRVVYRHHGPVTEGQLTDLIVEYLLS